MKAMKELGKLLFTLLGLLQLLVTSGNTLDVLRIHYASCFRGQLGEIRDVLNDTTKDHTHQVWVHDNGGRKPHTGMINHCNFDQINGPFFYQRTLGPLEMLAGPVHDLAVVGDVSSNYINTLT